MSKLYFKVASDWQEVVRLRNEIAKLETQIKSMDANKAPHAVAVLNNQMQQAKQQMQAMITEAAKAGAVMENGFKTKIYQGAQAVNDFTQKIIIQKTKVRDVEEDVRRLSDAYRNVRHSPMKANIALGELNAAKKALQEEKATLFGLQTEQNKARLSVKKLRDEYTLYQNDGKQVVETNKNIGLSLGKVLGVVGGVAVLKRLGSEIIRVRGEFQSMQTAMETMVGKDVAGPIMAQVKELAKISPLTMTDMVGAEKMMLGFNIQADDTIKYLKALSDISMGESGKFNSLTLAFSQMSATGKLMGQDLNQMINAGFNPLQTISEKTGKSIATLKEEMSKGAISAEMVQQAFVDATSAGGKFYNMSENASKTINGQISMMQDALDNAFNEMGQASESFIMSGIQATTSLIQNYEKVGKVLVGLVATYGTYRTAIMLVSAAESKHSLVEIGLTNVRILARKAQIALNAAMLTNPYVLLATAVIGLGAAMWAFSDSATEAEKAQKRFNNEQEKFTKREEERKQKIEDLIRVIKDETETEYAKIKAYEELQKYSPALVSAYKREELAAASLTDTNKKLNEERDKINYDNIVSNIDRLTNEISKIDKSLASGANRGYLIQKKIGEDKKALEQELNVYQKELEKINQFKKEAEEKNKPLNLRVIEAKVDLQQIEKEFAKVKKKLESEQAKLAKSPWMVIPFDLQGEFSDIQNKLKAQQQKVSNLEDEKNKKETIHNKKHWEKIKKDAETARDALDVSQKNSAEWKKYEKQIIEAQKNIDAYSSSRAEKDLLKEENIKRDQEKQQLEKDKRFVDQENELEQQRIDIIASGAEKERAQRKLDHKKTLQQIDRQQEDLIQKQIDDAKKLYNDDPKNKKGTFYQSQKYKDAKVLSGTDQDFFAQKKANEEAKYNVAVLLEVQQKYTDERIQIEKRFNDEIDVLRKAKNEAEQKGETQRVQDLNSALNKAITEKGKSLLSYDLGKFKESPEYIKAFEDLGNVSSETLNHLLAKLEEYKLKSAESLDPTQLREYTATIQDIQKEINNRDIFGTLAKQKKEVTAAYKALIQAENELNKSRGTENEGKALENYRKAKDRFVKANNEYVKSESEAVAKTNELISAIRGIGDVVGGEAGRVIDLISNIASFALTSMEGVKTASTGASKAVQAVEKASVILGIIGAAIQLIQQLNSLLPDQYSKYEKYAEKVSEINKMRDAVNEYKLAVLEAQHAENGWFAENRLQELKDFRKMNEEVTKSYFDKLFESQAVYQNKSGGGWLTKIAHYTNPATWLKKMGLPDWMSKTLSLVGSSMFGLEGFLGQAGIMGTEMLSSDSYKYDKNQVAAIANLRIETRKAKKGFLGTGIGGKSQKTDDLVSWVKNNLGKDLFDKEGMIDEVLAKDVLERYGDKLVGQTKETLKALVDLKEKYNEFQKQLQEYVSSLYEPLVDNIVDSLWDWLDEGKGALDSFKDYASNTFRDIVSDMLRTIVLKDVVGDYKEKVLGLYKQYSASEIKEEELMKQIAALSGELSNKFQNQAPVLQGMLEKINEAFKQQGIDLSNKQDISQTATKRGVETITQDQAGEMTGRMTDLQMTTRDIKSQSILHTYSLNLLSVKIMEITYLARSHRDIADETRTILADSYIELRQIAENTGAIVTPIKEMNEKLGKIQNNTDRL